MTDIDHLDFESPITLPNDGSWSQLHDRVGNTWDLGDYIEARMRDGVWFKGILTGIFPEYITINQLGFPLDDVMEITC